MVARDAGSSRCVRAPSCSRRSCRGGLRAGRRPLCQASGKVALDMEGHTHAKTKQVSIGINLEPRCIGRVRNGPARRRRPFRSSCVSGIFRGRLHFLWPPSSWQSQVQAACQARAWPGRGQHAARARTSSLKKSPPLPRWRPSSFCRGALGNESGCSSAIRASTHPVPNPGPTRVGPTYAYQRLHRACECEQKRDFWLF